MKKFISAALAAAITAAFAFMPVNVGAAGTAVTYNYNLEGGLYDAQSDHTRQMESLNRGIAAVKTNDGVHLSWRLYDSEDTVYGSADENVTFDIYRDGVKINTEPVDAASYTDTDAAASATAKYAVVPTGTVPQNSISMSGDTVTVNAFENGFTAYAAEYNGNKLEKLWAKPAGIGTTTETLDFTPDKVFLWDGMKDVNGTDFDGETPIALTSGTGAGYFDIPLTKPASETIYDPDGNKLYDANFFPADCSTGDLDGDGEYEIIVKWTSSEKDVGSPGTPEYSGTVRFAAYKLDGTKMWQNDINLGKNVYSSAHTVQFLVYDFNGDGKAEMMCQTSRGSKDASGAYVSHSAKDDTSISSLTDEDNEKADYRGSGRIITGDEYLTVFNGETGAAIDTIALPTARGSAKGVDFGDDFGNRSNRFVASVAYLDGVKPYAVYLRGYYFGRNGRQRTSIAGVSFDGKRLSADYRFDTQRGQPGYYEGAYQYVGNGNHNCTVADVDNDGKDEFITGALCMEVKDDNTFKPRWCTFMEHGDALHIGDYDPTVNGLEFFTIHEDSGPNTMSGKEVPISFGMTVINSDTGEIIKHWTSGDDNGRGIMANIGAGGYYQITSANAGTYRSNGGSNFTAGNFGMSQNFRVFWDGDLYDELLDGTGVTSWNGRNMSSIFDASAYGCTKINGTKANPALQADLFGDWREELVYPTTDGNRLRVFMTTTPTTYKIKTLMHDPVYRSGVAAEQTAYNQPPHVGFYMADEMFDPPVSSISITSEPSKKTYVIGETLDLTGLKVTATLENGVTKEVSAYSVSGFDSSTPGEQPITVSYRGKTASFTVNVKSVTKIEIKSEPTNTEVYQGGRLDTKGLVVTATYDDNTTADVTGYTLEYSTNTVGSATVTVKYFDCEATFNITVLEAKVGAINKDYVTDSTTPTSEDIPIGEYRGNFTLEHKVTVNSLPANGNDDRTKTNGFFLRFMGTASGSTKAGTGGGWQIVTNRNRTYIQWKSTDVQDIAEIQVGQTYTFKYEFVHVGDGTGASVTLTITDSDGNPVGSASNLNLRNFSNDDQKSSPITTIQVNNQANANSTANVTISDAAITSND